MLQNTSNPRWLNGEILDANSFYNSSNVCSRARSCMRMAESLARAKLALTEEKTRLGIGLRKITTRCWQGSGIMMLRD